MKQNPKNLHISEHTITKGFIPSLLYRLRDRKNINRIEVDRGLPNDNLFFTFIYSEKSLISISGSHGMYLNLTIYYINKKLSDGKYNFDKYCISFQKDKDHLKIKDEILDNILKGFSPSDIVGYYKL